MIDDKNFLDQLMRRLETLETKMMDRFEIISDKMEDRRAEQSDCKLNCMREITDVKSYTKTETEKCRLQTDTANTRFTIALSFITILLGATIAYIFNIKN